MPFRRLSDRAAALLALVALYFGTAIAAAIALAPSYPIAWVVGAVTVLLQCVRSGVAACRSPDEIPVAFYVVHYSLAMVVLTLVPFGIGQWLGRTRPRRGRVIAWITGGVFVVAGTITLAIIYPGRPPLWVIAVRPLIRLSASWYYPVMWYRLNPLLDAARLAALLPALLLGASRGRKMVKPLATATTDLPVCNV